MLEFIERVALGAGDILLQHLNSKNVVKEKEGLGFVGEADLASERFIIEKIERNYPGSRIIAEESGESRREESENGLTWIIDPLDGTTNFIHNFPMFAVSIGLLKDGCLEAGVVYNPATKELFSSQRGKGAFLNGERIRVSKTYVFKNSLFITGFYYFQGEKLQRQIDIFARVQEITQAVRRLGAASLDICYVACGRADGFWEAGLNSWDVAAGTLILKESGGSFTDFAGKEGDIFSEEAVYTNGLVHDELIKQIQG